MRKMGEEIWVEGLYEESLPIKRPEELVGMFWNRFDALYVPDRCMKCGKPLSAIRDKYNGWSKKGNKREAIISEIKEIVTQFIEDVERANTKSTKLEALDKANAGLDQVIISIRQL